MMAVKAYYDGTRFIPLQEYTFKPSQQGLIVVEDQESTCRISYSKTLAAFRAKFADFLENKDENADLDAVFENVRDKTEQLRGTESAEWQ